MDVPTNQSTIVSDFFFSPSVLSDFIDREESEEQESRGQEQLDSNSTDSSSNR